MAEENNKPGEGTPDPNKPTTPPESGSVKTDSGEADKGKEQMIPKQRLDEVLTEVKELRAWKVEQETKAKQAEDEKLKAQGKIQELLDKTTAELTSTKEQLKKQKLEFQIYEEARKAGVVDPQAAVKLVDANLIKEENGTFTGVNEAIVTLVKDKPYLAGKTFQPVGSGANPGNENTSAPRFRASQLQDAKFYQDNYDKIQEAIRAGTIENDLPQ